MLPRIPHVVVIGAGYAGLPCALRLGKASKSQKKPLCRVTLINPEARQELVSELYRAFRNGDPTYLPFLGMCKNSGVDFIEGRVTDINPQTKSLIYKGTQNGELQYDYLVIASGLKRNIPDIEGLQAQIQKNDELLNPNIFFFRNNHQATALRLCFNRIGFTEKTFRKNEKDFFTVILGAGATGLEIAGEIAALRGRNEKARVILLDQRGSLLSDFSPIARKLLKKELGRQQIETILGSPAIKVTDTEIFVENGQVVPWDLMIFATGSKLPSKVFARFEPNPSLPGLETRLNFEVQNHPDHFAIGDVAHSHQDHHPLANKIFLTKSAQYAVQEGHFVASLLQEYLEKGESFQSKIFKPTDLGFLLSLGPWSGIGRIGPAQRSTLKKYLSPFIVGPMVDELKRLANLKYRAQMEWDSRIPF